MRNHIKAFFLFLLPIFRRASIEIIADTIARAAYPEHPSRPIRRDLDRVRREERNLPPYRTSYNRMSPRRVGENPFIAPVKHTKKETRDVGRMARHFETKHDEPIGELVMLMHYAKQDHPHMTPLELIDLVHNRQHTSLDWDAGHAEEDHSA